jgi:hypothetical protein
MKTVIVNETAEDYSTGTIELKGKQPPIASGTMKPDDFGTMKYGTMKADKSETNNRMPSADPSTNAIEGKPGGDVEELNEMLKALESNMEMELQQIRLKYDRKRAPIIAAINAKKPGTARQ